MSKNSKILYSTLLLVTSLFAEDGFDDEDGGFGDDEPIEVVTLYNGDDDIFSVYGDVSFATSYNYAHDKPIANQNDFRGFSSLKLSSDINIDYKLNDNYKIKSTIKGYKDFIYNTKEDSYIVTPNSYDQDLDINELYIQGSLLDNLDMKIGRQIVVWGKSDNIRIVDSLNSMDNRTPGMVDIEDLRLGRAMSKFDYYVDKWSLSAILLNENRYSLMPQYGSDFAPANQAAANNISIDEPSNSISNMGYALSVSGNLEGQDLAFYYNNQYIDNTTYKTNMYGMAYNKVLSSFLIKTELAYFDNYDNKQIDSKIDGLIGFEYNGISDGSVSLEVANKNDDIQYALRFTQNYMNQTLDFTALYSGFGKDLGDGGFIRLWFDYAVSDTISSSFGLIDYIGGDLQQFDMIEDNDRLFANIKYSF